MKKYLALIAVLCLATPGFAAHNVLMDRSPSYDIRDAGVLEGVCRSLKLHGFHDIVLIGDHGSDIAGQEAVAAKLNAEWAATPVRVHAISVYYRGDMAGDQAEMMKRGIKKEEFGNH